MFRVDIFLFLVLFPAAMTAAGDSVSGWLEVKGQRVKLTCVFAAMAEDTLEGPDSERIEVLLSDKPVPQELRKATEAWSFWAGDQAQKGELRGIILYIDPEKKAWTRGQRLSANGMEFYSHPPEDLIFTAATGGAGEVAGKVSMPRALRAVDESSGPWRVEAEFRAAVLARPAITATYTGADAVNSGPYKAVQSYLRACQKKNLEAIRQTLNRNARQLLAKYEASQGKQAVLDMFVAEAAGTAKLKLTKVVVRADTAEVIFGGPGESLTMRAVLENGVWMFGH